MEFLIQLLVNAGLLVFLSGIMPGIKVKSYGTAVAVALVIGLLNATVGFLMRLPLNILTLGLLSFLVRLFVTAVMIRITDRLFRGFEVASFKAAIILAVAMALAASLVNYIFYPA